MMMPQRLCVVFLIGFVCCTLLSCAGTGSPMPTLYESHPGIFSKFYSTAEIEAIELGFKADPSQYTLDFAHMILWRIHIKNREFSRQLAKLPNLNDGITSAEARALSTVFHYIEDINFTQRSGPDHLPSAKLALLSDIISDGMTNDRYRYSPSLEALLWLILDERFNSWLFASQYSDSMTLTTEVWGTMSGPRWEDYDQVQNRLNTPELVHYYINNKISFRNGPPQGASVMFKTQKGQSIDAAYFAQRALKRAGYQTFIRSVRWNDGHRNGRHTGSGIILDDGRYLLVADFNGHNRTSGSYGNSADLDSTLAAGKKITDRIWGVYDQQQ